MCTVFLCRAKIREKDFETMKRTVKVLALVLVFAMAMTMFVGCGKRLKGTYEYVGEDGKVVLLAFDGNDFTYTTTSKNVLTGATGTTQLRGTYKIEKDGDNYSFTMICDEAVTDSGVQKYEEPSVIFDKALIRIGEDYISIGSGTSVRKYVKK